jgi:hypothetical protein
MTENMRADLNRLRPGLIVHWHYKPIFTHQKLIGFTCLRCDSKYPNHAPACIVPELTMAKIKEIADKHLDT